MAPKSWCCVQPSSGGIQASTPDLRQRLSPIHNTIVMVARSHTGFAARLAHQDLTILIVYERSLAIQCAGIPMETPTSRQNTAS